MKRKTTHVAVTSGNENIYRYRVVIYRDEDGVYIAECPALQGCVTDGATFEEALDMIKDAIALNVRARLKMGDPIPVESDLIQTEVSVAV